jgi:Flp pilus assembly protein protease CpaA
VLSLTILLLGFFIIVKDFRTHRISNISTLVLLSLLLSDPHFAPPISAIVASLIFSIAFHLFGIGMGDLKLIVGLIALQGELILSIQYLQLSVALLSLTLLGSLLLRGNLKGSVAFAHVILGPFLLIYLAI